MRFKWFWPLTLLVLAPAWMGLNKEKWKKATQEEEQKVLIGHACDKAEDRQRIEKNSNTIRARSSNGRFMVVDQVNACGYHLVSGKKNLRVPGSATEEQVLTDIEQFFPKPTVPVP